MSRYLPDQDIKSQMIRVNQAGEYGAVQIYKGQLAVLGKTEIGHLLEHMLAQEKEHLKHFNAEIVKNRIRPTALSPLWAIAGFALGAGTALLGKKAAMACTVAVEEVISEHYRDQEARLDENDQDLKNLIRYCRLEEEEHHQISVEQNARQAPFYPLLSGFIKGSTRLAIALSKRF